MTNDDDHDYGDDDENRAESSTPNCNGSDAAVAQRGLKKWKDLLVFN